jgi:hypothetical protein
VTQPHDLTALDAQAARGDAEEPRAPFGASGEGASRGPAATPTTPLSAAGLERHGDAAARTVAQAIVAGADRNRIELRLDPPELGRVSIDLRLDDGAVTASVSAERPETLDLLRRHADALQRELSSAGFERATLAFGDRGDGREGDARGLAGEREAGDGAALAEAEPAPAIAPPRASGPLDRLDIRL